jgi:hypothetical protein
LTIPFKELRALISIVSTYDFYNFGDPIKRSNFIAVKRFTIVIKN